MVTLQDFIDSGLVTYRYLPSFIGKPGQMQQLAVYDDCFKNYGSKHTWIGRRRSLLRRGVVCLALSFLFRSSRAVWGKDHRGLIAVIVAGPLHELKGTGSAPAAYFRCSSTCCCRPLNPNPPRCTADPTLIATSTPMPTPEQAPWMWTSLCLCGTAPPTCPPCCSAMRTMAACQSTGGCLGRRGTWVGRRGGSWRTSFAARGPQTQRMGTSRCL